MPPVKREDTLTNSVRSTVNIETCLLKLRNLCRDHGLQIWDKQSLSDQIYQDLLFIWHIPRLIREDILNLDAAHIGGGKMSEVSYSGLLSLKEEKLIASAFKTLWRSLQRSEVSAFFDGREFSMFSIEKKENKAEKYFKLLKAIVEYFASIELASYDSNAGYTYFKKDLNKGTAKTFGQFYTPKPVLNSVVQEVNPQPGEKILDPSSGSCSFIQETAIYLMNKHKLSPKEAFENLFGVEIEQNIYQEGAMNIFLNFGLLPNMSDNIREGDSFHLLLEDETKYDKIVANPPFGADASSFFGKYFKEENVQKGKRIVKVRSENPEVKVKIPFTQTKESAILFFQIIIQKLVDGGKAGVVMSATILNDSFKDMMKWFLECCSLEKVIINPAGTFKDQGTGIETFSFIFTKGSPTTKVDIVMLGAEDVVVRSLTLDQIKEAGWKLQLKEEEKKVEYTGQYELKKLGDIANGNNGKGLGIEETMSCPGSFPILSGGINYCGSFGKFNRDENTISLSKSGSSSGYVKWNSEKFWASDCFTIHPVNTDALNNRFLYYTLVLQQEYIYKTYQVGGTIPHCYWRDVEGLQIPLPPLPIQQEIVATLDRIFADPQDMKDCLAFTDKAMVLMLKDPSGKLLEDVIAGLRLKRSHLAAAASIKAQKAAVMRSVEARGYEKKKLGDLYNDTKTVKRFNSGDRDNIGEVPFFNGKWSCPDGTHSDHSFESDSPYFVMIKDGGGDHNSDTVGMGKFFNLTGKCAITSHNMVLSQKVDNTLSHGFVYHYLCSSVKSIRDMAKYSINLGSISKESIMNFQVPYPPLPIQKGALTILNEMESELKAIEQMAAKAEQRTKYILYGYLSQPAVPSVK